MNSSELKLLQIIMGDSRLFSLERRVLNAAIFAAALIGTAVFIESLVLRLPIDELLLAGVSSCIYWLIYKTGRREKECKWLVWFFLFLTYTFLLIDWSFVGGTTGIALPAAVALSGVLPIILRPKQILAGAVYAMAFFSILILIAVLFSENIPHHADRTLTGVFDAFILSAGLALLTSLVIGAFRHQRRRTQELNKDLQNLNAALEARNQELHDALIEINELRDIIPICSYCKKIRDDEGAWDVVESYMSRHLDAKFSHGICPDCYKGEKAKLNKLGYAHGWLET